MVDSLEHIFHCSLVRPIFPPRWQGDLSKCFLSVEEGDDVLASLLVNGVYAHHCAARHASTPAHAESKASIARLIGDLVVSRHLSRIW